MSITRRVLILVSMLLAAAIASDGARAGEWIDLGASEEITVELAWDPQTLVRIPPGAFGDLPAGTLAFISLDAPTCNSPNCVIGQGFLVTLDDRGCCGDGLLEDRPGGRDSRHQEICRHLRPGLPDRRRGELGQHQGPLPLISLPPEPVLDFRSRRVRKPVPSVPLGSWLELECRKSMTRP
jgi:hypothetical protein